MTERLAGKNHLPNQKHETLYGKWAEGHEGVLISGNVIIDKSHLESAGNIVADINSRVDDFTLWVKRTQQSGCQLWIQLSHAGRQTNIFTNTRPLSASNVKLKKFGFFGSPRPMTQDDIMHVIDKFGHAADILKSSGVSGIQIHSAHGYLLSQFLSPRTNKRHDDWGGNLMNRSRLLLEIIKRVRTTVGADFPISVKLNSADFQRGGFQEEESLQVIKWLEEASVDLLEISGGTYEHSEMLLGDDRIKASTRQREAYFITFAEKVRSISKIPLMVTGGFRSRAYCNEVLSTNKLDFIGVARPFLVNGNFVTDFLTGKVDEVNVPTIRTGTKGFEDMAEGGFWDYQIERLANGKQPDLTLSPKKAAFKLIMKEMSKGLSNKF
jgi:2,4-dienoyl-CoA reductase-like NADH-dependent reductase (Old Yellow Enzyme family)